MNEEYIRNQTIAILSKCGIYFDDDSLLIEEEMNSLWFISTLIELETEFDVEFSTDNITQDLFLSLNNLVGLILEMKNM